jgi:hypothetical protein
MDEIYLEDHEIGTTSKPSLFMMMLMMFMIFILPSGIMRIAQPT